MFPCLIGTVLTCQQETIHNQADKSLRSGSPSLPTCLVNDFNNGSKASIQENVVASTRSGFPVIVVKLKGTIW